jgi:hypothetical protein
VGTAQNHIRPISLFGGSTPTNLIFQSARTNSLFIRLNPSPLTIPLTWTALKFNRRFGTKLGYGVLTHAL